MSNVKCNIGVNERASISQTINSIIGTERRKAKKNGLSQQEQLQNIKAALAVFLNELPSQYAISTTDIQNDIVDLLSTILESRGYNQQDQWFSRGNIKSIITDIGAGTQINNNDADVNDKLKDTQPAQIRKEASLKFLDDAFGLAREAKSYLIDVTNQAVFDCLFINRGNIDGIAAGEVTTSTDLNENIRTYQNFLLNQIFQFLKEFTQVAPDQKIIPDAKKALDEFSLDFRKNKVNLYYREEGKVKVNKSLYNSIMYIISNYFSPNNMGQSQLIDLFHNVHDASKNTSAIDKLKLDAYNAYLILGHFDSFLLGTLGKAIQIKDFNQKTGEDKYQIADQTTNVSTQWRTSDNISPEAESDAITRMAIITTPLYIWQSENPTDQFLKFSDFQYIIGKIKDLAYNPTTTTVVFDENMQLSSFWNSLSQETRNFLDGKSLRQAINLIRLHTTTALPAIFELLSNKQFADKMATIKHPYGTTIYSEFNKEQLSKLYSLYRGIFSNTGNSINSLSDSRKYFQYITQSADSIFNVHFLQYYRDEQGQLGTRTYIDQALNNIERKYKTLLNLSNGVDSVGYMDSLNTRESGNNNSSLVISFDIGDISVSIPLSSGKVSTSQNIDFNNPPENIINFIDRVTRLNLQVNVQLKNRLYEQYNNNAFGMYQALFDFASRIIANQYVAVNKMKNLSKEEVSNMIKEIYSADSKMRYNTQLRQMEVISEKDIVTLNNIITAQSLIQGISTATTYKDSQGNSQSAQSPSRLLGALNTQFEVLERRVDSATKNCLLMTTPGLLEQVYTCKEFADYTGEAKDTVDSSVAEMAFSELFLDFIGGQENTDGKFKKNHISFLPSVNSDKNTIGRALFNLNIPINGKPLIQYSIQELQQLISSEFGTIYSNMLESIKNEFLRAEDALRIGIEFNLFEDYVNNFNKFNALYGNRAYDAIREAVLKYNKNSRLNPIELIDNVHIINDGGFIRCNNVILSQIARFNPTKAAEYGIKVEKYPTSQQFWQKKNFEVIQDLYKAGLVINTSYTDNPSNSIQKLRSLKDWIDPAGDVIIAKWRGSNGRLNKIDSIGELEDLIKKVEDSGIPKERLYENLVLHPFIEKYNLLDYLLTQEFMLCSVGSFVGHPDKSKSPDVLESEAAMFAAQHKRNVSMTASMHEFQLGQLNGIPSYYNIATVEDIKDYQGTINGVISKIKPFDGATFVNPFIVILENRSLCGASAGNTKKQFVHFKNHKTGTGGIIKTAGFGLNNDWIRNSPFLAKMMYKMTRRNWLDARGQAYEANILEDYNYNRIAYNDIYFRRNGKIYWVTNIERKVDENGKVIPNTYTRTAVEVDITGNPIVDQNGQRIELKEDFLVNSNYSLWNLFGGAYSMELDSETNKLKLSNTSVENVVIAMNSIGYKINQSSKAKSQDDVFQPLKHSDIHYVATEGAVKQGAANINSANRYYDDEDLNFQRVLMLQAGIQLDKEHHADDSELSLMTQVISACAAKGYTFDQASQLYDALSSLTRINAKDFYRAMDRYIAGDPGALEEVVLEVIISNIENSKSNSNNFIEKIAEDIIKKVKAGEKVSFRDQNIPFSDNTIQNKIFSIIASYLTSNGIKQKISGILSVMTPSFETTKVWNGKKYEEYENPEAELAEAQKYILPVYNSLFDFSEIDTSLVDIEIYDRSITDGQNNKALKIYLKGQHEKGWFELVKDNEDNFYSVHFKTAKDVPNPLSTGEIIQPSSYEERAILWDQLRKVIPNGAYVSTYGSLTEDGVNAISKLGRGWEQHTEQRQAQMKDTGEQITLPIFIKPGQGKTNSLSKIELGRTYTIEANTEMTPDGKYYIFGRSENPMAFYDLDTGETEEIPEDVSVLINSNGTYDIIREENVIPVEMLVNNPADYNKLKRLEKTGRIQSITENITVGRNLAAYNVRFTGSIEEETDNGVVTENEEFQIWDLDSINAIYDYQNTKVFDVKTVQDFYNRLGESVIVTEQNLLPLRLQLLKKLVAWRQQDMANISPNATSILEEYNRILEGDINYDKWARQVNILLGTGNGNKIYYLGAYRVVDESNFMEISSYIQRLISNRNKVSINGKYYSVDKNSIVESAYEVIMPKTFATAFGLKEFDSLNSIKDDPYFFVKQLIDNFASRIDDKYFDLELKVSTNSKKKEIGNHYYLAYNAPVGGTKITAVIDKIDNKFYRIDSNQNIMYEVTPDTEIYNVDGTDIIVTKDIDFYVDNLHYDTLKVSKNVSDENFKKLSDILHDSSIPQVMRYIRNVRFRKKEKTLVAQDQLYKLTKDTILENLNHPFVKQGIEKYNSFIRSLDIVATRTPSQSMQSFMPMKVIAFDNPDINTAYVSDLQILLQGSDYDIDAVSLATYSINQNGILQLHSPYADLSSQERIEKSFRLPKPSGNKVSVIKATTAIQNIQAHTWFNSIKELFDFEYDTDDQGIPTEEIIVRLKENCDLDKLAEVLKVEEILTPNTNISEELLDTGSYVGIDVESFLKGVAKIIDRHNLYFNKLSKSNIVSAFNNLSIYNIYNIIKDPINLIQAQAPVDETTGPLKDKAKTSKKNEDAKSRTPGNFVNKLYSILENQVGKKGIGICAVGLKTFFGLTQYYNTVLNSADSTRQQRLLLGVEGNGITIGGKTYNMLANVRAKHIDFLTNPYVLAALSEQDNTYDCAVILSGLLSLSTDNAKELSLSKLNATTKTLGMYVYGLTIGMQFNDIADILMSPVGDTILQLLEGNVFTGQQEFSRVGKPLFNYIENGPNLNKYLTRTSRSQVLKQLKQAAERLGITVEENDTIQIIISKIAKNQDVSLANKLKAISAINIYTRNSDYESELGARCVKKIKEYVRQIDVIYRNESIYNDFKTLAEGAEEMRIMGQIFSLNQGIKTDIKSFTNQLTNITHIIYNKTGNADDIIDIVKFVENAEYRQEYIERFESVRHTFNVLDAVTTNPHTMEYISMLSKAYQSYRLSYRFRSAMDHLHNMQESVGNKDNQKLVSGMYSYLGDQAISNWMLRSNTVVTIPEGNKESDDSGNITDRKEGNILARLGTNSGNISFRLWVENEIIPTLQNGQLSKGGTPNVNISSNKFLKDLIPDVVNRTISRNPTIVYTLPINMMPRNDTDRALFNKYKAEFNKLNQYSYTWTTTSYDSNEKAVTTQHSMPLIDIFLYYAMIANNWKQNESSLVSIFEDFQNTGLIDNFHKYESEIDKNGEFVWDEEKDFLIPYIAPSGNLYTSYYKYIWARGKDNIRNLYKRNEKEVIDKNEFDNTEDIGLDYEFGMEDSPFSQENSKFTQMSFANTKYIYSGIGDTKAIRQIQKINDKAFNRVYNLVYNGVGNRLEVITSINGVDEHIDIPKEVLQGLYQVVDGKSYFNVNELIAVIRDQVENIMNECK